MPLLSITGLNSNGQTFTIAHAYFLNKQSWVFWWILSHTLPHLLGAKAIKDFVDSLSGYLVGFCHIRAQFLINHIF
jgi:hypothetical protein